MQTTPNLGMTIPSSDQDPFDELVFVTALIVVDTWSVRLADLTVAATQTFTGPIKTPTPGLADNSTTVATTAFVQGQGYATIASPAFTGTPTAPTPLTSDNSTTVATTAFVKAQGYLTSFNGRTAQAVVPTAGDYTAAMVTNAADKSSGSTQIFTSRVNAPNFIAGNVDASGAGGTLTPNIAAGLYFSFEITANGNLTIANATNAPGTGNTTFLAIYVSNAPGNSTAAITWGTVYKFNTIAKPTSLAQGVSFQLLFIWTGGTWNCVGQF